LSKTPPSTTPPAARRARKHSRAADRRIPTGEPARAREIDQLTPPHPGDLPGELGPPAGESSRVR
jgi:hypothetical protein